MSAISTPSVKGKKYLRHAAWFLAITASLVAIVYFGFFEYARYSMRALNCKTLSAVDFDMSLSKAMSEPLYSPEPGKPVSPVHFKLDFGLAAGEDTIVRVGSDAAGYKLVYRGSYKKELTILAGEELLGANNGSGGDNFSISIIQRSTRKMCGGVIESIQPWQANKTVHIKLLPFRELNAIGLPVTFKVRVD